MKTGGVRLGIRSKLIYSFGFIIVLLAAVSAAAYISFARVDVKVQELLDTYVEFAALSRATESALLELQILEKDFFLNYRVRGLAYAGEALADARNKVALVRENLKNIQGLAVGRPNVQAARNLDGTIKVYEENLFAVAELVKQRADTERGLEVQMRSAGDGLEKLFRDKGFNIKDIMIMRRFEQAYLGGSSTAAEKLSTALQQMKQQLDQAPLKDAVKKKIDSLRGKYEDVLRELRQNEDAIRLGRTTYTGALNKIQPVLWEFYNAARVQSDAARAEVEKQSRNTRLIVFSITGFAVFLALLFSAQLSRGVTRQVQHIMNLFDKISVGDYRARTPVTSNDELGMMAGSLNTMLDNVVVLIQTREERDRMQAAVMKLLEDVSGIADGDLTKEAEVTEDFTGAIADAFNMATAHLRKIIRRVQESTNTVSGSAHTIYRTAEEIAHGNESGAMGVSTITAAIDEMAASIQAVSDNAEQSADVADQALESSKQGAQAVLATIDGMNRIRERVQETAKRIKRLGESSQEIGEIVQVINDLADRTSILALNASIQAAMAGEQGRGFAVVAEEVERLAQRSARATEQIANLVSSIQGETNETVVAMEETTREVVGGSRLSNDAGQALSQIENVSRRLAELIQSISLSSKQQARAADDVSTSMNQISEITQQTADGTRQAAASIRELATLADDLRESVSTFKLPESGAEGLTADDAIDAQPQDDQA